MVSSDFHGIDFEKGCTVRDLNARIGRGSLVIGMGLVIAFGWATSLIASEPNAGRGAGGNAPGEFSAPSEIEASPTGMRILYAPSDFDVPQFRQAIARMSGATVDYMNAMMATPSAAILSEYDCVFTYANNAYADNVLMGDNLAAAVDAGRTTVVLGSWSVPTAGNALGGAILGTAYSPVMTPTGNGHYMLDSWAGGGIPAFTEGVFDFTASYRDELAVQGTGIAFSTYLDGEIAVASRFPDYRVTYLNGATGVEWDEGDWPLMVANACRSGAFDVLVMDGGSFNSWEVGGVSQLAANFSVVGGSQFNVFLTAPDRHWDLVLVDCPSGPPTGGWDDLIAFVNAGGKAVMSFWNWSDNPALAPAFGFTSTTSISLAPADTYEPAGTTGGAYAHAGVGDLPSNLWVGPWGDDGDVFGLAAGSEVIGVINGGAVSGPVVIRNPAGNAIAAFVLDSWGSSEAEALWKNLAARVMDRTDLDGAAIAADWFYPDAGTVLETHAFVVDPVVDLPEPEIINDSTFSINLRGPYILWDFNTASSWAPEPFNGWRFSDLTGELPAIGSAWFSGVTAGVTGIDPHSVEYSEDWVQVNLAGVHVPADGKVRLEVFFGLWADGFETGDTARWTTTVGGP